MHTSPPVDRTFRPRSRRTSGVVLVTGLLGIVTGIYGLRGAYDFSNSMLARRWPTVPGVVTNTEVRSDVVGVTGGKNGPPRDLVARRFYVAYSYTVDRRPYKGNRVDATAQVGKDAPHQYQLRYPVGGAVTVHFNSSAPEEAVLEIPWPIASMLRAIAGLLLSGLFLRWTSYERRGLSEPDE